MSGKIKIELGDRYIIHLSEDACIFIDRYDGTRHWTVYFARDYVDIHETCQIENERKASIRLYYDELAPAILDVLDTALEKYRESLMQACIRVDDPTYKNWVVLPVKIKSLDEISLEEGKKGRSKITEQTIQRLMEFDAAPVMFSDIMQYDFDWAWVLEPPTGESLIRMRGEDKYLYRHNKELSGRISQDLVDRIKPLLRKEGSFSKPGCPIEDSRE